MIKKIVPFAVINMFLVLLLPFAVAAQGQSEEHRAEVSKAIRFDTSKRPLRDEIDPVNSAVPREGKDFEPGRPQPVGNVNPTTVDPLVERSLGSSTTAVVQPKASTTGVGVDPNARVAPPDTTGDLGPNHYVQWVNSRYAIYTLTRDSSNAISGFNLVAGFPKNGNAVFAGMNSRCATTNDGDPIVQYDQLANRWVLTQFVAGSSPYLQCVAVSTTPDPTGTYYRYEFSYGTDFNDYGKMGVWTDGTAANSSYVMTFNMFKRGRTFAGGQVCAYERDKMILGAAARQVCARSTSYGSLQPTDIEGTNLPAAGTASPLLSITSSSLLSWKFAVNWNAGTGSLTGPSTVAGVAAFSRACGGGTCIPQPGTTQQLDSLADRLMYRLSYRKFTTDGHESLLVNHSVATGGTTGVRWYELRNASTTPTVYQQGTFAPDSNYRWMGSAAMDKTGGIGIGYNVSNSSNINPGVRYTGRGPNDTLGAMGAETTLLTGPGVQTGNQLSRWGDYSTLSIDPLDGCTMVFTTEFIPSNGSFNWSTYIGSFKLSTCQ